MPFVSQQQRRLMYAAAAHKGGIGGVSQSVAKDLVAEDKPGKLPKRKGWVKTDKKRRSALYRDRDDG